MIADSSFLVALFVQEDENHEKAMKEASNCSNIIIPDRVLEETISVLIRKRGVEFALLNLNELEKNRETQVYNVSPEETKKVFSAIAELKVKMSFIDYLVCYLSARTGQKPLCFDREILKTYGKIT